MEIIVGVGFFLVLVGIRMLWVHVTTQKESLSEEIKSVLLRLEQDRLQRMRTKCSGLFGRFRRELAREGWVNSFAPIWQQKTYFFVEQEFNHWTLRSHEGGAVIHFAVREDLDDYTSGQIVAYDPANPTIHGCKEDMSGFVKCVAQRFDQLEQKATTKIA